MKATEYTYYRAMHESFIAQFAPGMDNVKLRMYYNLAGSITRIVMVWK